MFFAYILQSGKGNTYYYGHCKDINNREQHNLGKVRYTKSRRPWKVIYSESFETKCLQTRSIEGYRYLKEKGVNRGVVERFIAPVLPQRDAFGKNRRTFTDSGGSV
jgi:putative endonuclease